MAKYTKSVAVQGSWVDKSKLREGMRAKIVTETNAEPSKYLDQKTGQPKMQDVCKVRFEGMNDPAKVSLNRTTINALVEAFGEDSAAWQGNELMVSIKKNDGKTYLYLIPSGFVRTEDSEGYTVIVRAGQAPGELPVVPQDAPVKTNLPF